MKTDVSYLPTEELLSQLMKSDAIEDFIADNQDQMQVPELHEHLTELCKRKGIAPRDLVRNVDIERVFGHQLLSGRRNINREYILKLAFGLGLDMAECQRLLTISGNSQLYPRIHRDAVIIYCLSKKYSYEQIQEVLHEMGMNVLGEAGKHGK
jgi:cyanate lyase